LPRSSVVAQFDALKIKTGYSVEYVKKVSHKDRSTCARESSCAGRE
jgi:hypothetical protein